MYNIAEVDNMTKGEQKDVFWNNISLLADLLDLSGRDIARKLRLKTPPFYNHIDLMEDGADISDEEYGKPFRPFPDEKLIANALTLAPQLTRSHLLNRPYCTSELIGKLLGYRRKGLLQDEVTEGEMTPFANILSANTGRILIDLELLGIPPRKLSMSRKALLSMQECMMLPPRRIIISLADKLGIPEYYRLYLEDLRGQILPLLARRLRSLGIIDEEELEIMLMAVSMVNARDELEEKYSIQKKEGFPDTEERERNELRSLIGDSARMFIRRKKYDYSSL